MAAPVPTPVPVTATIPEYVSATAVDTADLDPSVYVDPRTGKALPILVTGTLTTSAAPPADPVATAALQTAGNASLAGILTALGTLNTQDALEATAANQTLILNSLASTNTSLATLNSDFAPLATSALQTTGNTALAAVLAALLAHPAGDATAALQTSGNAALSNIMTALAPAATAALQTAGNASLASLVSILTPNALTPSFARTGAAGSTVSGKYYSLTIFNSGTTDGVVQGAALHPGEWVAFAAPLGDTLAAISYTPGTEFTVTSVG